MGRVLHSSNQWYWQNKYADKNVVNTKITIDSFYSGFKPETHGMVFVPDERLASWNNLCYFCYRGSESVVLCCTVREVQRRPLSQSCDQRKPTIQHDHHTVCLLCLSAFTDQPIKIHKTAYLKLLCLPLSPLPLFSAHIKTTAAKVWFIMLFLFTTSTFWWRFILLK